MGENSSKDNLSNNLNNAKYGKIESLQALRGIAFIAVFLSHTDLPIDGLGPWAVSIFLVLSGFVMTISKLDKSMPEKVSLCENARFAWRRVRRLYPLHLVTTLAMALFLCVGNQRENILRIIIKLVLNVLLIHEWMPIENVSINGVSWYLSTMVFCYFIFPWIIKLMKKDYGKNKALYTICVLYVIEIIVGCIVSIVGPSMPCGKRLYYRDFVNWLIYRFPLTRSIEFVIGCNVGYIFYNKNKENSISNKAYNIITVMVMIGILFGIASFTRYKLVAEGTMTYFSPKGWWSYVAVFTPSSCLLIYILSKKSRLAHIITNRVTLYIGNISMYTFLIHRVVFEYLDAILCRVTDGTTFTIYSPWVKLTVGFFVTIIVTKIWICMIGKDVKF